MNRKQQGVLCLIENEKVAFRISDQNSIVVNAMGQFSKPILETLVDQ